MKPILNSLHVADYFDKRHDRVLRAIRSLEDDMRAVGRDPSSLFIETEWFYRVGRCGSGIRSRPAYLITPQGFEILVLGFTGKVAMDIQLSFMSLYKATSYEEFLNKIAERDEIMFKMVEAYNIKNKLENIYISSKLSQREEVTT